MGSKDPLARNSPASQPLFEPWDTGYQPSGVEAPVIVTVAANGITSTMGPDVEELARRLRPSVEITVAIEPDAAGDWAATDATAAPERHSRIKATGTKRKRAFRGAPLPFRIFSMSGRGSTAFGPLPVETGATTGSR
jgi:hypothetical protein